MPIIQYKTTAGKVMEWVVTEDQHDLWKKYKSSLSITEPCNAEMAIGFRVYLKKFLKVPTSV